MILFIIVTICIIQVFFDTTLDRYPRRSCEATFYKLMHNMFLNVNKGFKDGINFDDINESTRQLIKEEINIDGNTPLSNLYALVVS